MKQEELLLAFEGRWQYKRPSMAIREDWEEEIKELCQDFFEAGFILGHGAETATISPPGFEEWWDMYDLKCARKDCEKKWAKLTPKEQADCIAATPAYVASTPDKQFRKRPLTYLNQKAFYDEIIIRHTPEQQRQQRLTEVAERIAGYTKAAK